MCFCFFVLVVVAVSLDKRLKLYEELTKDEHELLSAHRYVFYLVLTRLNNDICLLKLFVEKNKKKHSL